ncbi:MAG TPA: hypothetical protein VII52_11485, partial [Gemmatimonadaceae bacterium]
MRPLRPVVALLANIVLIHAMWIGSSYSCTMLDHSGVPGGQMAGNDMSAADMSAMGMPGAGDKPHAVASVPHRHAPCRIPWSPDGCQSLTPCLAMAMTPPAQTLCGSDPHPAAVRTGTMLM